MARSSTKSIDTPAPGTSRNGNERREEILQVATDLFFERGFENGSLRDIAKVLNFTQAAIYYHFTSKDEIFFSILDRFTEMVFQAIKEELDTPAEPVDVLRSALRRHVTLSRDYTKEVKLLIEDRKLLSAESAQLVQVKERKIFDLYKRHFERLRAADLVPAVSPTVITFSLLAAANSVYQWYDRDGPLTIDEIAEEMACLFIGPPNRKKGMTASGARRSLAG